MSVDERLGQKRPAQQDSEAREEATTENPLAPGLLPRQAKDESERTSDVHEGLAAGALKLSGPVRPGRLLRCGRARKGGGAGGGAERREHGKGSPGGGAGGGGGRGHCRGVASAYAISCASVV
ncbi:hypothetical protein OCS_02230 [Ophiocordyceps sinensis CO18]|uniref:Uncharacterized protein n=1 Tax=Ophiocordyceps sinensis (strain Co18 / CGMCC 3.14243) TaxID=911162 RepID=T5AHI9_OPHSC|nr:hypothetical protein OCS_02230 [Ophiocordyceps sinensis CO18]